ncbi:hypothetical protein Rs2_40863 [Raphanus sativus]|nr:hypothetical protein Rs2_40863 [Raphanus sativus]
MFFTLLYRAFNSSTCFVTHRVQGFSLCGLICHPGSFNNAAWKFVVLDSLPPLVSVRRQKFTGDFFCSNTSVLVGDQNSVVDESKRPLHAGYEQISERDDWKVDAGKKYVAGNGFHIIGAHTDIALASNSSPFQR